MSEHNAEALADLPDPARHLLDLMRKLVIEHPNLPALVVRMDRASGASIMISFDPKHLYEAALALPAAWGADSVTIGSDTWQAEGLINPQTGEVWQEGEMSDLAAAGLAEGVLQEAILVVHAERRDETISSRHWSCLYERRPTGLWWLDVQSDETVGGRIPEAVTRGMTVAPPMVTELSEAERTQFTAELAWRRYEAHVWTHS